MIAITPMPPTISAIDEMTTRARNVALADLIPDLENRILREQVEVVRLVEPEAVADTHHPLDVGQRLRLGDARRAARPQSGSARSPVAREARTWPGQPNCRW